MSYKLIKNLTAVNYTKGNTGRKYIVIHYTGNMTDTAWANSNYFKAANRGASAHYFIDKTTIYQVVSDEDTSWAVGVNYGVNNLFGKCTNSNSISLEMCSNNGAIAKETYDNTVELTKKLMKKYNIPASNVIRHFDCCSKLCPGWKGWVGADETIWKKFKKDIVSNEFQIRVIVEKLPVRKRANSKSDVVENITDKGTYTIVKTQGKWGKLKSGKGWVSLLDKNVKKI